ncbi:hypothetical protein CEE37_05845 [candidate division LCP-89 bacterium B3_LCP]|uniref:Helix-turn-helix domain-containing protein n=1 Tax=candidate division LCP-89 bacterium B3_LCP TaxID=2012998 RepID=A0A532V1V1_UNCL8|nr:MAG: hypothetical protein CEE37_05845 [candidate division LCP-89 bacterium B3_LCP]
MDANSRQLEQILAVLEAIREQTEPVRDILTVDQAADYLAISNYTLREWVRLRKVPHHKVNKQIRFKKSKLDKWLDRAEVSTTGILYEGF